MLENYYKDPFGVIHQREIGTFEKDYASQYNNYGELSNYMAYLRYGYIHGVIGKPSNILDIGYGNGSFLKVCRAAGVESFGYDVSDAPVPVGCVKIQESEIRNRYFDVITMFDSYEHFSDLEVIREFCCKHIVISVPNCDYPSHYHSDRWFSTWKHRRPDEHLHHFNTESLKKYVEYGGKFECIATSFVEDVIRKGPDPNILTMVFKRK